MRAAGMGVSLALTWSLFRFAARSSAGWKRKNLHLSQTTGRDSSLDVEGVLGFL